MCGACQELKAELKNRGIEFVEREFELDSMLERRDALDRIAMATYHFQDETLPVLIVGGEGVDVESFLKGRL